MSLVRGWCPGALRPMESGDGLILRLRPPAGRLTRAQAFAIADIAESYGNAMIDLTRRAHLQLRGLTPKTLPLAQARLAEHGLIDPAIPPETEARLNILVAPFPLRQPQPGLPEDATDQAWAALRAALLAADAPALPAKFGFAIDLSWRIRYLAAESADIRIETGWYRPIIVRPDGAATGRAAPDIPTAVALAMELARWFVASGGVGPDGRGRMRAHLARGAEPPRHLAGTELPASQAVLNWALGRVVAFDFGAAPAPAFRKVAAAAFGPLRLTPWRGVTAEIFLDRAALADDPALILRADDPRHRRFACVGSAGCPQALGDPRATARRHNLLPPRGRRLHLSGCAKGCAHPDPADFTLTCTGRGFRLAKGGRAGEGRRAPLAAIRAALQEPAMPFTYETEGSAIYRQSFAIIRAEADLARFAPDEEPVVVRMIHAAGLVGLERDVAMTPDFAAAARAALAAGAPILCDARMVSEGITRDRLPCANPILCTLHDPRVTQLAADLRTTRSAAALELWRPHLEGAVVAIGNAPTALFHLLNMLEDPACPRPAAIIGCPVGFVGAAESKEALWQAAPAPCLIVRGRLGGSAITVAAVNALASRTE